MGEIDKYRRPYQIPAKYMTYPFISVYIVYTLSSCFGYLVDAVVCDLFISAGNQLLRIESITMNFE